MIIPKTTIKPTALSPQTLIIYGNPKVGKTSALISLPNCITISMEPGVEMHDMVYVKANDFAQFVDACDSIKRDGTYKFIAIDTVSRLEDFTNAEANRRYRRSNFGRNFEKDGGEDILTELEHGAGYMHARRVFNEALDKAISSAPKTIFIAHSTDKVIKDQGAPDVTSAQIDLIGKHKQILCARGEIGHLVRKTRLRKTADGRTVEDGMLNFKTTEKLVCGARFNHLAGKEFTFLDGETLATNWHLIYPDLFPAAAK